MNYPNDPNKLDWGSMNKAEFKRAELHYELRDEDARLCPYYVLYIDGKAWQEFYSVTAVEKSAETIRRRHGKHVEIKKYYQ